MSQERKTSFELKDFKRLGTYLKPYQKPLLKVLVVILLGNLALMLGPVFTQQTIDKIIPAGDWTRLLGIAVLFVGANLVVSWAMRYRIFHLTEIGQEILRDMRYDIFSHIQTLPFTYFDSRPHGTILTRVVNYINTLSDVLSNGVVNLISDLISLILALGFMLSMDVRLTLFSLTLVPFLILLVIVIQKRQRVAYDILSETQSEFNAYLHESITGIYVTQSFSQEETSRRHFVHLNRKYRSDWMKAVRIMFKLGPGVEIIATASTSLLYLVGVMNFYVDVSTGTLIAFVGFIHFFWNPIISIGNFYNQLVTASVYIERIFEVLDLVPEVQDAPDAIELPPVEGEVTFHDVVFKYDPEADVRPTLDHISFTVPAGESLAIVGPTGAGKTTIVNLLSRFYNVTEGSITIDGWDIADVTLKSLRQQIGVMLQDPFIFSGTILDNIRYGKLDASREEVEAAAKAIHAHDFIQNLPQGYDTVIEERGATLSAGQQQLIALARTLLSDPRILILDEATSSIDTQTEKLLQEGLNHLMQGRTTFVIAHRLATIKNADTILYVDDGRILEMGSHDELMEAHGAYYRLYQSQYQLLTESM